MASTWRSTSRKTESGRETDAIRGELVRLVPLAARHSDRTRAWANDPELMRLLGRRQPVTEQEHERWFAELASSSDRRYMAIEDIDTGEHVGNVWLWAIDKADRKAELRIVLGAAGRAGRGAGTEAIGLMSAYALGPLDLRRVYAYVLEFNERARRAFEKAGFTLEGVLKADRLTAQGPVDVYLFGRVDGGAKTP